MQFLARIADALARLEAGGNEGVRDPVRLGVRLGVGEPPLAEHGELGPGLTRAQYSR